MNVFKHQQHLKDRIHLSSVGTIGLVPTMGAIHGGHLSLIKKSTQENDLTVVSIFVNPTQFDNSDDLKNYPRTFEEDKRRIEQCNPNIWIYAPQVNDLYEGSLKSNQYDLGKTERILEGASREGHFQGVATVVQKLFEAVQPNKAYFGEKDFQQIKIIELLVQQKQIPVQIIRVPIVRHSDGLAMSSRNERLSTKQREHAPLIYKTLQEVNALKKQKSVSEIYSFVSSFFNNHASFELDYFKILNEDSFEQTETLLNSKKNRMFIAVKMGEIRLIDNLKI